MKRIHRLTAVLLICALVFTCGVAVAEEERNTNILANSLIDAMVRNITENYKFGADSEELYRNALREIIASNPDLTEIALEGIYRNLDKYSTYFDSEDFASFMEGVNGEFCGIGVTIMEFGDGLLITEVHKDSAAEKAGLMQGDTIISADGTDIRGMDIDMARRYVIGPEGSSVTIGIVRDGKELTFTMTRGIVTTVSGYYQVLEGNIGYIQLSSFDDHSPEFIAEALEALKDTGNIIFDLRYNPGGALEALRLVAGQTLPKGAVMHLEYKNEENNVAVENEVDGHKHDFVVLVNRYTASAAEAFSAAVQDYGVGVVVGEQTTGKGTMQIVNPLITGGGYKLTVAEYLSPLKRKINDIGVEPDYNVALKETKYSDIYFEPITYERVMHIGDTGRDVLALEQRLDVLGYSVGIPDTVYNDDTFYAVRKYQADAGLYPYGVLDMTTQMSIYNKLQNQDIVLDKVLEKGIELAGGDLKPHIEAAAKERAKSADMKK